MRELEEYIAHADELAQEVVNAWGVNVRTGNSSALSDEFMSVFDLAYRYRKTKELVANHREFGTLSAAEEGEEKALRLEFAEAYKVFWEKHNVAA